MSHKQGLRILAIGAHPDDCDIKAGGVALMYSRLGHHVRFLSLTNGDTGHHEMGGGNLARRRLQEGKAAAKVAGVEYQAWDIHCGELMPTLENRRLLIRRIREFSPDLIMTHRPNDYHPDHRYASQLVQDACYLVTVPGNVALTPHMEYNPVAVYFGDRFRKPYPFTPDVIVNIDHVWHKKVEMMHAHTSQMYEWLPYNYGNLHEVPKTEDERLKWLGEIRGADDKLMAETHRSLLATFYDQKRAAECRYAEAFEACEYGSPLTPDRIRFLFPFF